MRRLRVGLAAILLTCGVWLPTNASPARADGAIVHVVDANIEGHAYAEAIYTAGFAGEHSVMLQEVCEAHYATLLNWFTDSGYTVRRHIVVQGSSGSSNCTAGTKSYLMVAAKGTYVAGQSSAGGYPTTSYPVPNAVPGADYGWACLRMTQSARTVWTCSTHLYPFGALNPSGNVPADDQAAYLRTSVNPPASTSGRVLAGDMNRRPCDPGPFGYYWGGFLEGDQTRFSCADVPVGACSNPAANSQATKKSNPGLKIDYIWANSAGFNQLYGTANKYCSASDHRVIWAAFLRK